MENRCTVVSLFALAVLGACYSPELTDCAVACSSNDECTGDQVCVAGGFCAVSGVDCREGPGVQPGPLPDAGSEPDAGPQPMRGTLRVEVHGEGKVVVASVGSCINATGHPKVESCQWTVDVGTTLQIEAMMLNEKAFDMWQEGCVGRDATCTVRATEALVVRAKFKK